MAVPGPSLAVRAAGPSVGKLRVYGLPRSGRFQLLQDGNGTGIWVLGPGRRLWKLYPRHGGGWQAVEKIEVPPGRVIPWTQGRMALVSAHNIRWIGPRGRILSRRVSLPHGWQWVLGAGIQGRVGRRVYEWTPHHGWHTVGTVPNVARGQLWAVGVVNQDPWAPGPDATTAPLYALWRQGPGAVLETFTSANGWRNHRVSWGRSADTPLAVSNQTLVIAKRPVTTLTIAPTDALIAKTIYQGQHYGQLNQNSTVLTTVRHGEIGLWRLGLFMGGAKPVFTVKGTQVLGQADEELLYRPTPHTAALVTFSPPSFPPFDSPPFLGPRWKTKILGRKPSNTALYQVDRRWVVYHIGVQLDGHHPQASLSVARRRYAVSPGTIVANRHQLWLLSPRAIWEVGPSGPPIRIAWPSSLPTALGSAWLQQMFAVQAGSTLYAALGVDIPNSVPKSSQESPLVHPVIIRVRDHHAAILSRFPRAEGAVTSLALGPGNGLYLALYTGHHNVDYGYKGPGQGMILAYNQTEHRWRRVPIPRSVYQDASLGSSLIGESIINLTVLPGPRWYFLVQSNPNGTESGLGSEVWEVRRDRVRFYDLPGEPLSVPYGLSLSPAGGGVLVNAGNVLALILPRQGLGYVSNTVPSTTERLGRKFLENIYQAHSTILEEVRVPRLIPHFLLVTMVPWPTH